MDGKYWKIWTKALKTVLTTDGTTLKLPLGNWSTTASPAQTWSTYRDIQTNTPYRSPHLSTKTWTSHDPVSVTRRTLIYECKTRHTMYTTEERGKGLLAIPNSFHNDLRKQLHCPSLSETKGQTTTKSLHKKSAHTHNWPKNGTKRRKTRISKSVRERYTPRGLGRFSEK